MKTLKKIVEAFKQGEVKARLERESRIGPMLAGSGLEFIELVEEIYAPYTKMKEKADSIEEPEGIERYAFRLAYSLSEK